MYRIKLTSQDTFNPSIDWSKPGMEAGEPALLDNRGRTRPSAAKGFGWRLEIAHARLVPEPTIGPFWSRSLRVRMRGRDKVLAPPESWLQRASLRVSGTRDGF